MFQIKFDLSSKVKISFVILIVSIVIGGCVYSPTKDRSFVTQDPCAAPCWQGLVPGQSTLAEVRNTLGTLPFIDQKTIIERNASWLNDKNALEITYECVYDSPLTSGCGGVVINEGKLSSVWMYIPYDLSFKDAAAKLKTPDYVSYFMKLNGCETTLIWSQKAVSAISDQKSECPNQAGLGQNGLVSSDLKITFLIYSYSQDTEIKPCEICIPWKGFIEEH